jgi:Ca-activated chloride channel family protein
MLRRSEECGAGSAWQGRLRDDDRQTVGIADITGGHAFRASTLDALDEAYATLQQHIGYEILHSDASAGWIRLGAGVLAASLLAGILLNRRLPG